MGSPDVRILLYRREARIEAVLWLDGRPAEWITEQPLALGDIVLGVCGRIHAGLASAFIQVGDEHEAILPLAGVPRELKPGRVLPVQIRKIRQEPGKGPVVDARIRLPGKYGVAVPGGRPIRRSRLGQMEPAVADRLFESEVTALSGAWRRAEAGFGSGAVPRVVCRFGDPVSIAIREWDERAALCIEGAELFQLVRDRASDPEVLRRMVLHVAEAEGSLWDIYGLESARCKMEAERVPLPCGGFLVIQGTVALTAIDVNSGSANASGPAALARTVNEEAARETARQMRLRNLTGTILIDFLRMHEEEDAVWLTELLGRETADDRGKVRIVGMTRLGLMETARSGC